MTVLLMLCTIGDYHIARQIQMSGCVTAFTHYKYVLVFVDEIMFIGKEPQQIFDSLSNDHGFKMECVGTPKYHLYGDFYNSSNGNLARGAYLYGSKMLTMFGYNRKEYTTPIIENDHLDIDVSVKLDVLGLKHYESFIGALQWIFTLGRFDNHLGVASIFTYCCTPCQAILNVLNTCIGLTMMK
jgi:hypothetical protein